MILSDGIHITSDTSLEELHRAAVIMGLSRSRYHGYRKGHPHYDLPKYLWHCNHQRNFKQVDSRTILAAAKKICERE